VSKSKRTHRSSAEKKPLLRRIIYFAVMIMTGGGAGIGGWLCKDYPQLQPIIALFLGNPDEAGSESGEGLPNIKAVVKSAVAGAFSASENRPGVYQVTIDTVQLDPKSFTPGRTVDIQARVRKIDADGIETLVWESKTYGENLAVVGRDELSAHWTNRPFEVEWRAGDRFMVEVYDRKAGFFSNQEFRMARRDVDVFPLSAGEFALEPDGRPKPGTDPSRNRVVLASRRTGDSAARPSQPARDSAPARRGPDLPTDVAERPIIIR